MVRHVLHLDTDNVVPFGIKKRYNIEKIKTRTSDDVFDFATERTHNKFNPNRKWLVKHCQVWKNLYKRTFIKDVPFIKGIIFEDFPWWSEIMLKQPRITVVPLPLYYYIPNFGGIVLSAKQLRIMKSLCTGIKSAYSLYVKKATDDQMKKWQSQFMWFFVNWAFRKLKYLKTDEEIQSARDEFTEMRDMGIFNDVPNEWYELRENIYKFIGIK